MRETFESAFAAILRDRFGGHWEVERRGNPSLPTDGEFGGGAGHTDDSPLGNRDAALRTASSPHEYAVKDRG